MSALTQYQAALPEIPAPGTGCHNFLMRPANLGIMAGLSPAKIHADIRAAIPSGKRHIKDSEISDAINEAISAHGNGGIYTPAARKPAPIIPAYITFETLAGKGLFSTEAELSASSPITIPPDLREQQKLFIETVFELDDFIFNGAEFARGTSRTILPACEWAESGASGPFTIVNPFSGMPGVKKDGGKSYRCDSCVKHFRHALVEFDNQSLENQIRFWSAVRLPVRALIHTGGKSIHAWLDIAKLKITTLEQWNQTVKIGLYQQRLKPLGVDMACSNPSRLSRMPGVFRPEKNQWQRLLWLSAEGTNV